jgi:hypothetical protein
VSPLKTWCGGSGLTVFYGMAKPVRARSRQPHAERSRRRKGALSSRRYPSAIESHIRVPVGEECLLPGLFAAKRVLEAADRVLNLSGNLVALALGLELGNTGDLADDFLHGTFGLLCRSLDTIFVHANLPFDGNSDVEDLIRHNRRAGALTQIKGADRPAPRGPQNCERTSILAAESEQTQHETEVPGKSRLRSVDYAVCLSCLSWTASCAASWSRSSCAATSATEAFGLCAVFLTLLRSSVLIPTPSLVRWR